MSEVAGVWVDTGLGYEVLHIGRPADDIDLDDAIRLISEKQAVEDTKKRRGPRRRVTVDEVLEALREWPMSHEAPTQAVMADHLHCDERTVWRAFHEDVYGRRWKAVIREFQYVRTRSVHGSPSPRR